MMGHLRVPPIQHTGAYYPLPQIANALPFAKLDLSKKNEVLLCTPACPAFLAQVQVFFI